MLPGHIAGFYTYDECHVDLSILATFAGARLIVAPATGIDWKVHIDSCLLAPPTSRRRDPVYPTLRVSTLCLPSVNTVMRLLFCTPYCLTTSLGHPILWSI